MRTLARPAAVLFLALAALGASVPSPAAELRFRRPGTFAPVPGSVPGVELDLTVEDGVVRSVWSVALRNDGGLPAEARLSFRLPPSALVVSCAILEEGRRAEAKLVPRAAGRRAYEAVVARREDPLFLELRGDEVAARLFPLPPHGILTLEVRLAAPLRFDRGRALLAHPFGPRPAAGDEPIPTGFSVFTLRATEGVEPLAARPAFPFASDPPWTEEGTGGAGIRSLRFAGDAAPAEIRFDLERSSAPVPLRASLLPAAPGASATLHVRFTPGRPAEGAPPAAPLLVVDSSGSTRGAPHERIAALLREARAAWPAAPAVDFLARPVEPDPFAARLPFGPSDPAPALAGAPGATPLLLADPADLRLPVSGTRAVFLVSSEATGRSEDVLFRDAAGLLLEIPRQALPEIAARLVPGGCAVSVGDRELFSGTLPLLDGREAHLFLTLPEGATGPVRLRHAGQTYEAFPADGAQAAAGAALLAAAADYAGFEGSRTGAARFALAHGLLCRHAAFLAVPETVAGELRALDPLLMLFSTPNFNRARSQAKNKACISNMKTIEGAHELFLMENEVSATAPVEISRLVREGYLKTSPTCPAGGIYIVRAPRDASSPSCEIVCSVHGSIDEAASSPALSEPDLGERLGKRLRETAHAAAIPLLLLLNLMAAEH